MPDQRSRATRVLNAFERDELKANTSWNELVPVLEVYANASKDVEAHGYLGSEGGVGWNPGSPGADLSTLAGQQKLGPSNETTVAELFKNKDGSPGTTPKVDTTGVKGSKKTSVLLNATKTAAKALKTAAEEHGLAQKAVVGTKEGLKAAVTGVEINEKQIETDKLADEKKKLEHEKEEALKALENVFVGLETATLIGFGIGEVAHGEIGAGAESILVGLEIGGEALGKAVISADYDPQIEKLDAEIKSAVAVIRGKQSEYVQAQLTAAMIAHQTAMGRVRTTGDTMHTQMAEYQKAHVDFAEEASKAAGGGKKGAAVFAAIEAIPKVELALGGVNHVLAVISPPAYTEDSGRGYNGFGMPADFVVYLGQLKGYRDKFSGLATLWKGRLSGLRKIASQFGI